jgi:two-component system NarL family sensor kinase
MPRRLCAPSKEPNVTSDFDKANASALMQLRVQYQELLERLENNQGEFQRLARSVNRVQEDERRRISRELHDGIGQNLTALKHQLAMIGSQLAPDQSSLHERLSASITLCTQTLEDTRQLSRLLRPQILDDLGLEAALRWLARTIESTGNLRIELDVEKLPLLDADLQTLLFRVAQEALANVLRHAQAGDVLLRLATRAGRVMLTIWDNGVGFEPATAAIAASQGRSAGLAGMRERARLYGGEIQIESGVDIGTRLRASFPLPPPVRRTLPS